MTEALAFREFRARLAEVIDRAEAGDSTVVTRNGRAVGAFVPMEVFERVGWHDEEELRRLVDEREDSPSVPMSEVMAETLGRDG
jgi:prevent-host-death family protein